MAARLILFTCILQISNLAFGSSGLVGGWQAESGREIQFFAHEDSYVGYLKIKYVTEEGKDTGQAIHYHFEFDREPVETGNSTRFQGKLRTYDTFYDCDFDNGDAEFLITSDTKATILIPKIYFKVRTYRSNETRRVRRPLFCTSHWGDEYICGWDYRDESHGSIRGRECVVTGREWVGEGLTRLSSSGQ